MTAVQVAIGDTNYDHQRKVCLDRLEDWTGSTSAWRGHLPAKGVGDHAGHRLIGGAFVRGMTPAAARVVHDQPRGFDHAADVFTGRQHGHTELLRYGLWAGKHDGDVDLLAEWVDFLVTGRKLELLVLTEMQQLDAARVVRRRLGPDWRVQRLGEFGIVTQRDTVRLDPDHDPRWAFVTDIPGLIGWRRMHVPAFDYRLATWGDAPLRVYPFHAPSSVQSGDGFAPHPLLVRASRNGFHRIDRRMDRYDAHHTTRDRKAAA